MASKSFPQHPAKVTVPEPDTTPSPRCRFARASCLRGQISPGETRFRRVTPSYSLPHPCKGRGWQNASPESATCSEHLPLTPRDGVWFRESLGDRSPKDREGIFLDAGAARLLCRSGAVPSVDCPGVEPADTQPPSACGGRGSARLHRRNLPTVAPTLRWAFRVPASRSHWETSCRTFVLFTRPCLSWSIIA